uniref:DNA-directed RNA polymerase subunit n=1 Tax=Prototheca cutis TaxID=575411 RepID=A0A2Z6BEP5_9CHLO|nr:beta chain of rna polymerase [Prototheca cutis]BBD20197.1 beta chain of rna polymerase [Prototheca cutis]
MKKIIFPTIKQAKIGLVSAREIQEWGEFSLDNGNRIGEIQEWGTINKKTLQPEKGGLFCQEIFGPVKDYTCACGTVCTKDKKFCEKCGVAYTHSRVRRYRFGHIKLQQPVIHPLFVSIKPSPLGISINWSNKRIENMISATEFCFFSTDFLIFSPWYFIFFSMKNNVRSKLKLPKLFHLKKINIYKTKKIESNFQIEEAEFRNILREPQDFFLYGIDYDLSWDLLLNIQIFLEYSWAIPTENQCLIPYYNYLKKIKNYDAAYQIREFSELDISYKDKTYPLKTGGTVIKTILAHYDPINLQKLFKVEYSKIDKIGVFISKLLQEYQKTSNFITIDFLKLLESSLTRVKRYRKIHLRKYSFLQKAFSNLMHPSWMILDCLPVLPPDLRPVTIIDGEPFLSDLNILYQKLLQRNQQHFFIDNAIDYFPLQWTIFDSSLETFWEFWCYNIRSLQEAVNSVLYTGIILTDDDYVKTKKSTEKKAQSLLERLKGKKGRFRQYLLGKRVDYSGRSVIVVGPTLKIYECGLPLEMAVELFQPYIIQKLKRKHIGIRTPAAKKLIEHYQDQLLPLLQEIVKGLPILLNRAPTLHRLGIQAFFPKIVSGKAILLHPLVCPAFNADFDGDQMAVHVPLSILARIEALNLIWSRNNILAPASGEPLILPAQDMILGCFYLTAPASSLISNYKNFDIKIKTQQKIALIKPKHFTSFQNFQFTYNKGEISLHTPIWINWISNYQNINSKKNALDSEAQLEYQIDCFENYYSIRAERYDSPTNFSIIRTTPGRLFFHSKSEISI